MITVLLLIIGGLILAWQLQIYTFQYKTQNLLLIQAKNHELINLYKALGQSIMALNIQLQAAQKLSQINPIQSQQSLSQAYQLSSELMQELRHIVRIMDEEGRISTAPQNFNMLCNPTLLLQSKILRLSAHNEVQNLKSKI
ncbi:histidine kinase dimerization/phosphoacceptor domain-containing protein [Tolypothrix sp. FACHB-123]|uniref:histidine kinase dimerization/phosphoacceptor domain-containing protein n=1 Tax=Tolypothrix sp. FACHB-123 TaxID=2692868 RepID=UPI001686AAE4|nr:histidine kinase dimerization/phosphoacceptor domain-containing protein [Tolypothrix sp. FACHB-123]MBD2357510.1 histidine kinase dimerization/phosphoacceptor domain-containing protein [Tolypothrix sp. FACHB-123]